MSRGKSTLGLERNIAGKSPNQSPKNESYEWVSSGAFEGRISSRWVPKRWRGIRQETNDLRGEAGQRVGKVGIQGRSLSVSI